MLIQIRDNLSNADQVLLDHQRSLAATGARGAAPMPMILVSITNGMQSDFGT
jgi:hypothetical protein